LLAWYLCYCLSWASWLSTCSAVYTQTHTPNEKSNDTHPHREPEHTHTPRPTHTRQHTHPHTHTRAHTHTNIHTHTHTHMHGHTSLRVNENMTSPRPLAHCLYICLSLSHTHTHLFITSVGLNVRLSGCIYRLCSLTPVSCVYMSQGFSTQERLLSAPTEKPKTCT